MKSLKEQLRKMSALLLCICIAAATCFAYPVDAEAAETGGEVLETEEPEVTDLKPAAGNETETDSPGGGDDPSAILVSSIELTKTSISLDKGSTYNLKVKKILPEDAANQAVVWSSSDESVATVKDGTITAVNTGTAVINVVSEDSGEAAASCKVTVKQKVTKITLNKTSITLEKSKSKTLKATIAPSDATDKGIKWTTSDSSVVSVSQSGVITAEKKGTAIIEATAKDGSKETASCKVTVRNKLVTSVKLKSTSRTLGIGQTYKIEVKSISPSNADIKTVSYTSSDKDIASVSSAGKITAKKIGTCTITVKAKDGSGKTATFKVTVRKYQRDAKYYQIKTKIKLPSGGYSLSTANIGLKVIRVNQKLLGNNNARYSTSTKNAVKSLQKKKGIKQTGIVNKTTWLAMGCSEDDWYNLGTYTTPLKITNKSTRQDCNNAMLKTAKEYADKGTVYRVGCSGKPGTYADCSGLIYQCLYSAGINPDTNIVDHGYAKYEYTSRWLAADKKLGKAVSYSNRQAGDLVFYSKAGRSTVVHVGIYAGGNKIYDAWPGRGVTKRSITISGYRVCKIVRVF